MAIKHHILNFLSMSLLAFVGGLAAQPLLKAGQSFAQEAGIYGSKSFYDSNGKTRLEIGMVNGRPAQNILGEDGKLRIQIGTYSTPEGGAEKELPAITLFDNQGHAKLVLRVAPGGNQSPQLILKDNRQNDRIVMGLALDAAGEDPFLAYFDKDGGKHLAFGTY